MADDFNSYGLKCYEGADPNTPSTAVVANGNGVTLFSEKTGRAAYHIVSPPRPDHVDNFINWGMRALGLGDTAVTHRNGKLVPSQPVGSPDYDPLNLAKAPHMLPLLTYTQEADQKKPQVSGCIIENIARPSPETTLTFPVIFQPPKPTGPAPVAPAPTTSSRSSSYDPAPG